MNTWRINPKEHELKVTNVKFCKENSWYSNAKTRKNFCSLRSHMIFLGWGCGIILFLVVWLIWSLGEENEGKEWEQRYTRISSVWSKMRLWWLLKLHMVLWITDEKNKKSFWVSAVHFLWLNFSNYMFD